MMLFKFRPEDYVPGIRVREREEEVPGFNVGPDGEPLPPAPREPLSPYEVEVPARTYVVPAAAGDLSCQVCRGGRPSGMTGRWRIGRYIHCFKCAVKKLGLENTPSSELPDAMDPYEIRPKE